MKTCLIVGAGFSCEAGVPNTKKIIDRFLLEPSNRKLPVVVEREISEQLKQFWSVIFGYRDGPVRPSLEDHFTVVDLAANTGRNIGREYTPKKLRAVRRLSIQRIFEILDHYHPSDAIRRLLSQLHRRSELCIVSTNWDVVTENHLTTSEIAFNYGLEVEGLDGEVRENQGLPLLMLHGSANWIYCDCCRRLFVGEPLSGKAALQGHIYVAKDDFQQLCPNKPEVIAAVEQLLADTRKCFHCQNSLGARLATFSYRKEISIPQFQMVWQRAFGELRDSDRWLFVGYSLPEADFEFRHLLKSAEKGSVTRKSIQTVLADDCQAGKRFQSFFGIDETRIYQQGLSEWITNEFSRWLERIS